MFTDKEHRGPFEFSDELGNLSIGVESADTVVPTQQVEANDNDLLLSTSVEEETRVVSNNGSAYSAPSYEGSIGSLIPQAPLESAVSNPSIPGPAPQSSSPFDDLFGLGLPTASASPITPAAPSPPPLQLKSKAVLDPGTFQQKWRQLPISISQVCFHI